MKTFPFPNHVQQQTWGLSQKEAAPLQQEKQRKAMVLSQKRFPKVGGPPVAQGNLPIRCSALDHCELTLFRLDNACLHRSKTAYCSKTGSIAKRRRFLALGHMPSSADISLYCLPAARMSRIVLFSFSVIERCLLSPGSRERRQKGTFFI